MSSNQTDEIIRQNIEVGVGPQTRGRNRDLNNISVRVKGEWPAGANIKMNTVLFMLDTPMPIFTTIVGGADNAELIASVDVRNFSDIGIHSIVGNANVDFSWSNDNGTTFINGQSAVAAGTAALVPVAGNYMKILQAAAGTATILVSGIVRRNAPIFGKIAIDSVSDAVADALLSALNSSVADSGFLQIPLNQLLRIPYTDALSEGSLSGGRVDMVSSDPLIPLNCWLGGN